MHGCWSHKNLVFALYWRSRGYCRKETPNIQIFDMHVAYDLEQHQQFKMTCESLCIPIQKIIIYVPQLPAYHYTRTKDGWGNS